MTGRWAIRMPIAIADAAAVLRLWPRVETAIEMLPRNAGAAAEGDIFWVRGQDRSATQELILRTVPGDRFDWLDDGHLRRPGKAVPEARLPCLAWQPIAEYFVPASQASAIPGTVPAVVSITLVPASMPRPVTGLRVPLAVLERFVLTAPAIRLAPLEFAVSADGLGIVRGDPLPPLPGDRFYLADGIWVPCGWACNPAVDAPVIRQWIGLEPGDWALLSPANDRAVDADHLAIIVERIPAHGIVAASRSAIRLTMAARERLAM